MVICLGWPLPATSSSLPAAGPSSSRNRDWCGPHLAAYLALLRLGVAVPPLLPAARWALTPPFHPYPPPLAGPRAVCSLLPFRRLAAPRRYLAVYPMELGLSSKPCGSATIASGRWKVEGRGSRVKARAPASIDPRPSTLDSPPSTLHIPSIPPRQPARAPVPPGARTARARYRPRSTGPAPGGT